MRVYSVSIFPQMEEDISWVSSIRIAESQNILNHDFAPM